MSRHKKQVKVVLNIRADLEAALGALADHGECSPRVEIRVRQAIGRSGLDSLLVPALDDLERMVNNILDAKAQVCAALEKME